MSDQQNNKSGDLFSNLINTIGKEVGNVGNMAKSLLNKEQLGTQAPAINIVENGQGFEVRVAAPGMAKEMFKVGLEEGSLYISSEGLPEKKENYLVKEFEFGAFKRSFTVPETVDTTKINGKYENGMLLISLPKKAQYIKEDNKQIDIW